MTFPPDFATQLDTLSATFDDGTDLATLLEALTNDFARTVPAFLGIELQLTVDGEPVVIAAVNQATLHDVRSSLRLPLDLMNVAPPGTSVTYYAAVPDAFIELARATRARFELDGQVELNRHLHLPAGATITGLDGVSVINQAIGVLMNQGHTPEQAHAALRSRAHHQDSSLLEVAQTVVSSTEQTGTK